MHVYAGIAVASSVAMFLAAPRCGSGAAAAAENVFLVDAFGAKPNKRVDSAPAVRKAIQEAMRAGGGQVRFGPGTYYMMTATRNAYAVWPRDVRNVHIAGVKGKTEIIVTDPHIGFLRFDRCSDCSLRNVIVDYETPPFTQGRIVRVDRREGTFDLKIDEGFPALDAPFFNRGREWGMPIHPVERRPKHVDLDHVWVRDWKKLAEGTWRLYCKSRYDARRLAVGDRYVQLARQKNHSVLAVWGSSRITMEDIVVHASPGITNGVVMSDAVVYRRLCVRFRDGTRRLITSNGDGIHVHGNRRGPVIEECYFEGICDDGVNLNSHMNPIVRVAKEDEIVVQRGPVEFRRGDRLQIFDPDTGAVKATVVAVDVRALPDGQFRLRLARPVPGMRANEPSPAADPPGRRRGPYRAGRIKGDLVYNLAASNAGFVIRRNTFRLHRRHGLLIRSGDGLIEGNVFDRICGVGILIMNGGVLEGPVASDVTIRDNKIVGVGKSRHYGGSAQYGAVTVRTNRKGHKLASARGISKIRILNNRIVDPPRYGIYVGAATDVTIVGNRVDAAADSAAVGPGAGVCIENASGVVVSDFGFADPRKTVEAGIVIRRSVDPGAKAVTIERLDLKLPEGVKAVLDRRQSRPETRPSMTP